MRIKVECSPPLPSLKVWFVVPAVSTIAELKYALWTELPGIQQSSTDDLTLLLDGFELIDSSSIDVIRDGELLTIKQTLPSAVKRKSTEEPPLPSPKRVKRTVEPSPSTAARPTHIQPPHEPTTIAQQPSVPKHLTREEHSSSSSSSSDSDSDSDSSSDSSSDSDSDSSDDSSSSDSSSAPSERPSKLASKAQANHISAQREGCATASSASTHHIPPGQGKATTQSRNARRRRKKMYERLSAQAEPSSANDIPLGPRQPVQPGSSEPGPSATTTEVPKIMMASLSNKNKRKGFKQALANPRPKKIVFSGAAPSEPALPFPATTAGEIQAAAPNIFPRLIPPSEKQENGQLPPNMFVTSIDVEEGMHAGKKKNKKKEIPAVIRCETKEVEEMVLDYGEPDDHIPTQREPVPATTTLVADWTKVQARWDSYAKITDAARIKAGGVVGWKALGINPATYTPEWLVNVGRVVSIGDKVVIKPLYKPGDMVDLEDEEVEISYDEEAYDMDADILAGDWRLI